MSSRIQKSVLAALLVGEGEALLRKHVKATAQATKTSTPATCANLGITSGGCFGCGGTTKKVSDIGDDFCVKGKLYASNKGCTDLKGDDVTEAKCKADVKDGSGNDKGCCLATDLTVADAVKDNNVCIFLGKTAANTDGVSSSSHGTAMGCKSTGEDQCSKCTGKVSKSVDTFKTQCCTGTN